MRAMKFTGIKHSENQIFSSPFLDNPLRPGSGYGLNRSDYLAEVIQSVPFKEGIKVNQSVPCASHHKFSGRGHKKLNRDGSNALFTSVIFFDTYTRTEFGDTNNNITNMGRVSCLESTFGR